MIMIDQISSYYSEDIFNNQNCLDRSSKMASKIKIGFRISVSQHKILTHKNFNSKITDSHYAYKSNHAN